MTFSHFGQPSLLSCGAAAAYSANDCAPFGNPQRFFTAWFTQRNGPRILSSCFTPSQMVLLRRVARLLPAVLNLQGVQIMSGICFVSSNGRKAAETES